MDQSGLIYSSRCQPWCDLNLSFYLDEPVYNNSSYRRKSVFAEAYNPEEDEGDETKVSINIIGYLLFNKNNLRLFIQKQMNSDLASKTESRLVSFSNPWTSPS